MHRVAFQGDRGAFSEEAARGLLGVAVETLPCRSFEQTFASVSEGRADCAVLPIENALAGSVHRNYDLLEEHRLAIAREAYVRIRLDVIVPPGVELAAVRRVHSHPVALAQCQRFLAAHPAIEPVAAWDTAGSVALVLERGDTGEAAIAGPAAAAIHGGVVVAESIEDHKRNYTRFLLLTPPDRVAGHQEGTWPRWKTSVVFRTPDRAGALFRALAAFALRDVNLSKIESRPIEGRPWEYSFHLDVSGRRGDEPVDRALAHLDEMAESLRILGSYPAADAPLEGPG
ncbi:MAG TPA: prephenate dehydratase [Thermoanaerobaculia bacterium]|nr:prephenate dehydratase [Thermoanaerobaculia bacterium]